MIASLLLTVNIWPRGMLVICFICFLSFVSAAQDFSSYQSDGMLLEAGFISLFYAPSGFRPGWALASPPSRASMFLLQWEWFRIYFESGVAKLAGGDPEWRNFTAMDNYYQDGPLPTWIGWYVQHLPHWFHAATVYATLVLELGIVWMFFLPRRWRTDLFLHRHAVGDRRHPHRQLHLSELPGASPRLPFVRRSFFAALPTCEVESIVPAYSRSPHIGSQETFPLPPESDILTEGVCRNVAVELGVLCDDRSTVAKVLDDSVSHGTDSGA